jgi:hypothetical protein
MTVKINPAYKELSPFIHRLPVQFESGGETIFKARNELKRFSTGMGTVVVKSFKIPALFNRIVYTFFRPSKALRSFNYAVKIEALGFRTPHPIAWIHTREAGLIKHSYYVSEYTEAISMKKEFTFISPLTDRLRRILKAFAVFTARLHEAGIHQPDYSNGNILYREADGEVRFELVDLNRVRFRKVSPEMGWRSFRRLDFSTEMLEIVAREYALQRRLDADKSIERIRTFNLRCMKPGKSYLVAP